MHGIRRFSAYALTLISVASGCSSTDSTTDLNPAGPPMLRQVRMNRSTTPKRVFAFGSHELAEGNEVIPAGQMVTDAVPTGQQMRLIFDELLVGNNLEEIGCRGQVDEDNFARVPVGATPDDVAACAVANDALPASCSGARAMCICQQATCIRNDATTVAMGEPVGILDVNQDGGADDFQFIAGSIGIQCADIDVPISLNGDLTGSYWNPSGNQQVPAAGGFDSLGPAVVLQPANGLPTNLQCHLTASDSVVDKDGNKLCAPKDGDVTNNCTAGDLNAFQFKVEPLAFLAASFVEGQTGVSRTNDALIIATAVLANLPAAGGITVKEGAANFTAFTLELDATKRNITIKWTAPGLAANTKYEITITPTVTDFFAQPAPAPVVFTFTTGA